MHLHAADRRGVFETQTLQAVAFYFTTQRFFSVIFLLRDPAPCNLTALLAVSSAVPWALTASSFPATCVSQDWMDIKLPGVPSVHCNGAGLLNIEG